MAKPPSPDIEITWRPGKASWAPIACGKAFAIGNAVGTKTLADAVHKALEKPEVQERLARSGTDVYWSDSQEFAEFVKTELVSWTAMIKEAGIEPE